MVVREELLKEQCIYRTESRKAGFFLYKIFYFFVLNILKYDIIVLEIPKRKVSFRLHNVYVSI